MKIENRVVNSPKGEITIYKLINVNGASVEISTLGAGIVSICVPDKNGNLADVVLGYVNPSDYIYDGPCAGKVPGRYANRIAKGKFTVNGKEYNLAINNGPNALHGGPEGYQNQIWNSKIDGNSVVLTHFSPDGDEGYPGNLIVSAKYTWTDANELTLELQATSDADTVINLTNHAYFNLSGEGSGSVLEHKLKLEAHKYLPTDDTLIPTGAFDEVEGTPMNFISEKRLGDEIKNDFPALKYGKGYDNCWVIDNWDGNIKDVAVLSDEKSGRVLTVATNQPAIQVYTGNWLEGCPVSKSGLQYHDYDGVALECQGMPDAPNKPQFPSQLLKAGDIYKRTIIFKFSNH